MNFCVVNGYPLNICSTFIVKYVVPEDFSQLPEIEDAGIIAYKEVAINDVDQYPEIGSPSVIVKFPLAVDDIVLDPEVESPTVNLTGALGALPVESDPEIETVSIILTQHVFAEDVQMTPENETATFNTTRKIYPGNIILTPSLASVFTGSLMALRLAEGSTRTPDAGISLDFPAGYIKGSSWYTQTTYRFVLKFHMLTDTEYHWLDGFLSVNRYNELDYAWPFDNRLYKCLLTEDLDATLIRSSTALGRLWDVTVNLVGYEVFES